MKLLNKALCIFLLTISFASCATKPFLYRKTDLHGMVYDFDNTPVPRYHMIFGDHYVIETDVTGRFTIEDIPLGTYVVKGSRNGYEDYVNEIVIGSRTDVLYMRVASGEQLLDLTDIALAENNVSDASVYVKRANMTGSSNPQISLYTTVIMFRQERYEDALVTLLAAEKGGLRDSWTEAFRNILLERIHK